VRQSRHPTVSVIRFRRVRIDRQESSFSHPVWFRHEPCKLVRDCAILDNDIAQSLSNPPHSAAICCSRGCQCPYPPARTVRCVSRVASLTRGTSPRILSTTTSSTGTGPPALVFPTLFLLAERTPRQTRSFPLLSLVFLRGFAFRGPFRSALPSSAIRAIGWGAKRVLFRHPHDDGCLDLPDSGALPTYGNVGLACSR